MISISGKNWEELKSNKRLVEKIKIDHNLSEIQAKLIISRSFSDEEIYTIKNDLNFKNPFIKTKDFLIGSALLRKHINKKDKILIIGDYDVDGCVSTSLMVNFLRQNKVNVNYYIPDRLKDGYGANKNLIINLINNHKPKLIFFLDCGSSSHEIIDYINKQNISSFIIDHHNVNKPFPLANVFINPKKKTEYKEYDYLCTAFLTYLFIDLFIKENHLKISIKYNQIYILLATVADIMPMRQINRLLALKVLKYFDINRDFIFKNLFNLLNIKKKLDLDDLGFLIAPILNSAGRLENANQIVNLFVTKSNKEKIQILDKIYFLNQKRKLIETRCLDSLNFKNISKQKGVIFIYKPDIPEGIIGIIASRIKEYFNKPCVVLTKSNELIKGSARSTSDFNIGDHIHNAVVKKILIIGGGHNLAAGMSLYESKIDKLKRFLNNSYFKNKSLNKSFYTSKISLKFLNKNFFNQINMIGPFGNGNANPIFLIENVKIIKPKILKKKLISCFITKNNKIVKSMSFNHLNTKISFEILNSKNEFNILVKIKDNMWNNKSSIELEIIDLIQITNKT